MNTKNYLFSAEKNDKNFMKNLTQKNENRENF